MFIDKTIEGVIKTSTGVTKSTGSLIKSSKDIVLNTTVNYTPDIYDHHQDYATGSAKFVVGNSVMVGRNLVRSGYSVKNAVNKSNRLIRKKHIKRKVNQIKQTTNQLNIIQKKQEELKKVGSNNSSRVGNISSLYVDSKVRKNRNTIIDLSRKKSKLEYKQKKLERKYITHRNKALHPIYSTKRIVSNQTRRMASTIKAKDDFGSQTIGMTMKSTWAVSKYGRRAVSLSKRVITLSKSLLSGILAFVTSIPALITTVVSCLPLVLIVVVIAVIISCFASTTFTGRIGVLYSKINELNSIYEVELDPAEILAITDTLEWTTQNEECYEQLVSIMLDQKKGNKLTFEQMAYNVFVKYNPANKYTYDGVYDEDMKTNYYYWSLEGLDINFIFNNSVKRNLLYSEHLDLYPLYRDGNISMRKTLSTNGVQNKEIITAKKSIEVNRERYEDYIYEYNLGDIDIKVTGDNAKGMRIVKKALTKLGCDYVWGAGHGTEYKDKNLDEFDCSGFVAWSFYHAGIDIGARTTKELVNMGQEVSRENIQPGDIIVYYNDSTSSGHVVIYVGNEKVVHAPRTGDVVKVSSVDSYINKTGAMIRRLY